MTADLLYFCLAIMSAIEVSANKLPTRLTWSSGIEKPDSVVLSEQLEEGMPYYGKIEIYRNGKSVFSFRDSTAEIDGSGEMFTEPLSSTSPYNYLIFRCSGRPQVDYFLVLKKTEMGYTKLGYTPSSSAEIFGDVDYDGEFEIGGFGNLHESGDRRYEVLSNIKREYKIFEVKPGFPLDSILTKRMLPLVIENCLKSIDLKK